ncbi:Myb-like DNA-binding domain-containing protein [Spironucleus salmonicida]|uniref:Myb-like DNA-binding domain-containing protein n=1 Tax=Spironucleus salmonicida TaxID=348837 RepID=V6LYY5_9EUKA|nr:Myb-like DNA-binding domain-containing protein [Spironucleus salmonicida]|eukprot:EST48946.1 Myb-like DNA-binding domain-containing protein [Spironucleus salmonicida]
MLGNYSAATTQKGQPRQRRAFDRHTWSDAEISSLLMLAETHHKRWQYVSTHFPHLTQNQVKNKYYYLLQHPQEPSAKQMRLIAFDQAVLGGYNFQQLDLLQ